MKFDYDSASEAGTSIHDDTKSVASSSMPLATRPAYVDPVVAEKEHRAVFWSRVVVILVLVIAVGILATAMYVILSKSEKDDFETQVCTYYAIRLHNFQTKILRLVLELFHCVSL